MEKKKINKVDNDNPSTNRFSRGHRNWVTRLDFDNIFIYLIFTDEDPKNTLLWNV